MSVREQLQARMVDLQTQLDRLDADYRAKRADLIARGQALKAAASALTPAVDTALDSIGAEVKLS